MNASFGYPYPTYIPSKTANGCVAGVVSISLIAWLIQSCQARFQPTRISVLLLVSHMTIFIELIVRATVPAEQQNSRTVFAITNMLFAIGQRMIIVGNFAFVMEIHHKKSRFILLSAMLCVITSGVLMVPANMLAFKPENISTSYLFRELSASILLTGTVVFYPVWYWSRTIHDMNSKALVLMCVSSIMCLTVGIFNLLQSLQEFYTTINHHEGWFFGFQMVPIIFAHFTWSVCHPKRSLTTNSGYEKETQREGLTIDEHFQENTI
ncbi:unnamed protein product [Adineta ricciae]|uniref:Uncharacterized protein n=2 Tax=Adineta ricciae TaxID=249248 RepID=A0A815AXZ7_ADIRI|nr:unnamed protein product [Adineta ricciae]